ncbi:MAG TPA: hypothetical protein VJ835_09930 [Fimbriimonadaceae bacterium]|nr:hypothetical protein [Fimbriimonadaceae bacterium]
MTEKQKIQRFRNLVDYVFSHKVASLDQFKRQYDEASSILVEVRSSTLLWALMKDYLELFSRYSANRDSTHYYRSDQLFQLLTEQSGKVTDLSLFENWARAIEGSPDTDSFNSFKKRYLELLPFFKDQINVFIKREREKRRKQRSLLDVLRDAYASINSGKSPSDEELDSFDPRPSVRGQIENRLADVEHRWRDALERSTEENLDKFAKQLQVFSEQMKTLGDKDLLVLFQAFKQVRDPVFELETRRRVLYYGLHAIVAIQIHSCAARSKVFQRNVNCFTPEEVKFFAGGLAKAKFYYDSNIEHALIGNLRNPGVPLGEITLFLNTYLWVESRYAGKMWLAPLDSTLKIQKKWSEVLDMSEQIGLVKKNQDTAGLGRILGDPRNEGPLRSLAEMQRRQVTVSDGHVLGTKTIKAGSRIRNHPVLGTIAIASIENQGIFVELGPYRPQLFIASKSFLADRVFAEGVLDIYNNTIGMVNLMETVLKAMGFMPALISGGFVGLIYEVATYFAGDWLQEQVAKIDPTLAEFLSLALAVFGPKPNFQKKLKTDMIEPRPDRTGLSDVLNPKTRGIDGGAPKAAASRSEAVASPISRIPEATVSKPLTDPSPTPATPGAQVAAGDQGILNKMFAEANLRTKGAANDLDVSLPNTMVKEETALASQVRTGTDPHVISSEAPTHGTATYNPSATRRPTSRPDTRFSDSQQAIKGHFSPSKPSTPSRTSGSTASRGVSPASRSTSRIKPHPDHPTRIESEHYKGGILTDADDALLLPYKGPPYNIKFKIIPAKQGPHAGGAAFQGVVNPSKLELQINLPAKKLFGKIEEPIRIDVDVPAVGTTNGKVLVLGEAKATFTGDIGKSPHLTFEHEKVVELSRRVAVSMEMRGAARVEIITSAPRIGWKGSKPVTYSGAGDLYKTMAENTIAREVLAQHRGRLAEYLISTGQNVPFQVVNGRGVPIVTLEQAQEVVSKFVDVKVLDFGNVKGH